MTIKFTWDDREYKAKVCREAHMHYVKLSKHDQNMFKEDFANGVFQSDDEVDVYLLSIKIEKDYL